MQLPPVTPEEVYLATLTFFCVKPPEHDGHHVRVDMRAFTREIAIFLLKELKQPDALTYPNFSQLYDKLHTVGPRGVVAAKLLEALMRNMKCPDDIQGLFEQFAILVVRAGEPMADMTPNWLPGVDPSSPFGLFLRRLRVAFQSMPFEGVARLYNDIAADIAAFDCMQAGASATTSSAPAGTHQARPGALRDRVGVELFLDRQLRQVEELGPSQPQALLEGQLTELLGQSGSTMPHALRLRLASALQHHDYTAALELMHTYYNYAPKGQDDGLMRSRLAAALLALSNLHNVFGHTQEALQALNETLRLAQQAGDVETLVSALSVMSSLLATTSPGAPGLPAQGPHALVLPLSSGASHVQLLRLLRRCQECGVETMGPHLTAFARLALARFALQHDVAPSDSALHAPPGSVANNSREDTTGSTRTVVASGSGAEAAGPLGGLAGHNPLGDGANANNEYSDVQVDLGPLQVAPLMVSQALQAVCTMGQQAALSAVCLATPPKTKDDKDAAANRNRNGTAAAAAAADLYPTPLVYNKDLSQVDAAASAMGVMHMCGAAHLLQATAWRLHGNVALEATHIMAATACYGPGARLPGEAGARYEDAVTAHAQLISAVAHRHGPAKAEACAAACSRLLPALSAAPAVAATVLCAQHDHALATGDMAAASRLVSELSSLPRPCQYLDADLRAEARRRGVLNLLASEALPEAQQAAADLFAHCAAAGQQLEAVRALLLLGDVHRAAGDHLGALPYSLAAVLPATGQCHDITAAEALLGVAQCWVAMSPGQHREALALVQDALPVILAHGPLELKARAQLAVAEIALSGATSPADLLATPGCYRMARRLLEGAAAGYQRLGNNGALARATFLLAQLHHAVAQQLQQRQPQHEAGEGVQAAIDAREAAAALYLTAVEAQ